VAARRDWLLKGVTKMRHYFAAIALAAFTLCWVYGTLDRWGNQVETQINAVIKETQRLDSVQQEYAIKLQLLLRNMERTVHYEKEKSI
jgi:hypothetical protein